MHKALTLTQPWASLVVLGLKRIETRSRSTNYRGPLFIHAAAGYGKLGSWKAMRDLCGTQPFFDALAPIVPGYNTYCDRDAIFEGLPLGAILGSVDLRDCVPTVAPFMGALDPWFVATHGDQEWQVPPPDPERSFGDYSDGRWALLLASACAFAAPIPAKGALGLWNWTPPDGVTL